ncbi:MAG: hypothetical protein HPY61_14510 [Methanotrichaceae archaeon]|nr:hypothetical protein [Methanotrichaceae archaeon]
MKTFRKTFEGIVLFAAIALALQSGIIIAAFASHGAAAPPEGMFGNDWQKGRMMSNDAPSPMGVPVEMIARGNGFAFQDGQSHLFRVNIVRLSPLDPTQVIDLLVSNKSIDEIREAIQAREKEMVYRGSMRLDGIVYPLTDVAIDFPDKNTTLVKAKVAAPNSFHAPSTDFAGRLNLTISSVDGGKIGEGSLDIESAPHSGSYQLLLDMEETDPARNVRGRS